MAHFELAIPHILNHEGGLTETKAGEFVNRGINTKTLEYYGLKGTKEELRQIVCNLSVEETEKIYFKLYWTLDLPSIPTALDQINSQFVANKFLDMCVLGGKITAIKQIQKAVGVKADGFFGKGSLTAINQLDEEVVIGRMITNWVNWLSYLADIKIKKAQKEDNPELVKYWKQVKVGCIKRANWNGR